MSKKKAPVVVTLKRTKHKTQPWLVIINKPGNAPVDDIPERYGARRTAYRAALRRLGLWSNEPGFPNTGPFTWNGHPVQFVTA